MNRSRKINTPLTLCASALVTLLALNAPLYAAEPDEELEVTMDVVDDSDHAAAGTELVVREDEADDADHDGADHENAEHGNAGHDDANDDADDDHGGIDNDVDNDNDEANEHEEADDGDVNDDGHDGDGEHGSEGPGVSGND